MNAKPPQPENESPKYWFPAKSYGWGWGLPVTWQGWLTLGLLLLICVAFTSIGGGSVPVTIAVVLLASILLLAVCFWKGEPPRWRWGKEENLD